ncbi:ABC transporter permease subunit [Bacillus pinisoli]|uniref:ABC transporter permease subunit n=1 Tax=Bacillus pinisoli TaxID=2901866 RepID=UPI001FF280C4|nr:ABC transporter permease subunit [Bacillus pinisoli]
MNVFRISPLFLVGSIALALLLLITFIGPYLPFVSNDLEGKMYILDENRKPVPPPYPPSEDYLLGTDAKGRDLLSVLINGAKETLLFILCISLIRYTLALPLGYMAIHNRFAKSLVMSWNRLFSYVPTFMVILILSLLPFILYSLNRLWMMIFLIAFIDVGRVAELYRVMFEQIKTKQYIASGISSGAKPIYLFFRYYLQPARNQVIVHLILDLGRNLLLLAQLGFASVFLTQVIFQDETGQWIWMNNSNNWPIFLKDVLEDIRRAIWIPFWASVFIAYTIFAINLFGEGLKDFFEKKARI